MNGLLYKDLLNLDSTLKYLAVMTLIFCVVFLPLGNELPVYIILIMFGTMLPTTAINFDTVARWDIYAASLPLSCRDIVLSKYLLMAGGICVAGIVSLVITEVMTVLMPGEGIFLQFVDPLPLMVIFVACGLILGSISLPLTLKFGAEKMRYIIIIMNMIMLTPVMVVLGMTFLMNDSSGPTLIAPALMFALLAALLAFTAVIIVVSYRFSARIYRNKEF